MDWAHEHSKKTASFLRCRPHEEGSSVYKMWEGSGGTPVLKVNSGEAHREPQARVADTKSTKTSFVLSPGEDKEIKVRFAPNFNLGAFKYVK